MGFGASGLHSNGYSLVRRIVADAGVAWESSIPQSYGVVAPHGSPFADSADYSLGHACLEPTRLYSRLCLDLENSGWLAARQAGDFVGERDGNRVHAFAHVTGGGLAANLCRVIPAGLHAVVDRSTWQVPGIFRYLMDLGGVDVTSAEDTWNLGVGMVALVHPDFVPATVQATQRAGMEAFVMGTVSDGIPAGERLISGTKGVSGGTVVLRGEYQY